MVIISPLINLKNVSVLAGSSHMRKALFLVMFGILLLNITACGQKGDLYLPQDPEINTEATDSSDTQEKD